MSYILSAGFAEPAIPPPLTPTMRVHLLNGLRASLRRDQCRAMVLMMRREPHDDLARRIARTEADLAELADVI